MGRRGDETDNRLGNNAVTKKDPTLVNLKALGLVALGD